MFKKLKKIYDNLKKLFLLKILRRKYQRIGKCKGCGRCCREIFVKHGGGVIKDEKEYNRLVKLHPFYSYLKIRYKDEDGLVFECSKLDKETGKCSIYKNRALLCRLYPQEEIFMLGGNISEDCGFDFIPLESFDEVFKRVCKKKPKTIF